MTQKPLQLNLIQINPGCSRNSNWSTGINREQWKELENVGMTRGIGEAWYSMQLSLSFVSRTAVVVGGVAKNSNNCSSNDSRFRTGRNHLLPSYPTES